MHGDERVQERSTPLIVHFGERELVIRKRYEVLSICNDILIAIWFAVGSVLFLSDSTSPSGRGCSLSAAWNWESAR